MTKLLVIDLDQTVIDSTIRENACYPNGNLCLDTYRSIKKCTKNGIVNDCLTPFGQWLKENYFSLLDKGYTIVFLTARMCDYQDFNSFKVLGINSMLLDHCLLIERGIASLYGGNDEEQDSGKYKKPIIWYLANAYFFEAFDITVIDDCQKVLTMARDEGFNALCARKLCHYSPDNFNSLFLS